MKNNLFKCFFLSRKHFVQNVIVGILVMGKEMKVTTMNQWHSEVRFYIGSQEKSYLTRILLKFIISLKFVRVSRTFSQKTNTMADVESKLQSRGYSTRSSGKKRYCRPYEHQGLPYDKRDQHKAYASYSNLLLLLRISFLKQ